MKKYDRDFTDDWKLYLNGIDYNNKLDPPYYQTIATNINMHRGHQWKGVQANGLPTPVFNQFKPIINHQIASITSQDTAIQLTSDEIEDDVLISGMDMNELTDIITAYFDKLWERSKMSTKIRELLLDGALTGDYCIYTSWDETRKTGIKMGMDEFGLPVEVMGEIENEIVDSVNVFLGNPNDKRINDNGRPVQPYIILAFRQMTSKLKEEAKQNKVPKDQIDQICSDTDTEYQAGDRGQVEIDDKTDESGKTTAIVKLWVKDGTIYARKSTKNVVVRKEWNTKRTLYPVAWGNWESIKNSYHGQALGTGLVPNQLWINKVYAMAFISIMNTAYPRMIYDKTRMDKPSNAVGSVYGVDGSIEGAMKYLDGGNMSPQVSQFISQVIQQTKETLGAYDAAMGNTNPTNTSAIIAIQQAAAIPLELIKLGLYQFIEDLGYIWLDTMIAYYGTRKISVEVADETGQKQKVTKEIDFSQLRDLQLRIKIDVGASAYWSQITSVQTLDNLLQAQIITPIQYLERLPDGFVNLKQELINELKALQEQAQQMQAQQEVPAEQVMEFIQSLPADVQNELMQMDEQLRYETAIQLMNQ